MRLKTLVALITGLFMLVAPLRAEVAAQVGGVVVTTEDVALRLATERAYGNRQVTACAALVALIQDAIHECVAREQGVVASVDDVAALAKHAAAESKSPQVLARVQAALASADGAYERLFLQPKVINRKLHEYFQGNAVLHASQRAAIESVLGLVNGGQALGDAAAAAGLVMTNEVLPRKGLQVSSLLEVVAEGAVLQQFVEDGAGFQIYRVVARDEQTVEVESVSARKGEFEDWFRGQAGTLAVRIADSLVQREIEARFAGLWWLANVQ